MMGKGYSHDNSPEAKAKHKGSKVGQQTLSLHMVNS
jgi:hypothetical protein